MNVIHASPRSTDRRREARTEALLDVALRVLAQGGVEALTLARVAEESGVVTTALYRYFPSKNALLAGLEARAVATLHERLRAHRAALTQRLGAAGEPPKAQALAALLSLPAFYAEARAAMPEAFRLLLTLLGDPTLRLTDDEASPQVPQIVALVSEIADLFERAAAVGALPAGDVAQRTRITWATLQGALALAKLERFDAALGDTATLGTDALTALLCGWGARPALVSQARGLLVSPSVAAPSSAAAAVSASAPRKPTTRRAARPSAGKRD